MTENQASGLIDYLKHEMGYEVKIVKPFPWNKVITIVSGVVVAIPILKFSGPRLLATIRAPKLWIAITLVSVLLFTSGHMFNTIRRVPYVAGDGKGGVTYFVSGHSNQIAVETQIIAICYAVMAFSSILLITKVPYIKNPTVQTGVVAFLIFATFLTMSFVISKFHLKNAGYPLWLLRL